MRTNNLDYELPIDVGWWFARNIDTILKMSIKQAERIYEEFGVTPIVGSDKYKFLEIDYGFFIWAFVKFIEMRYESTGDADEGVEIGKKIMNDFLLDDERMMLSRNGKYIVSVLNYLGLSYADCKRKSFYTKILYKKKEKYFLLNSIKLSKEGLEKFLQIENMKEVLYFAFDTAIDNVAFDRQVGSVMIDLAEESGEKIKILNFWNRKNGLSKVVQ